MAREEELPGILERQLSISEPKKQFVAEEMPYE
jgi:hypothetical protein